MVSDKKGIKCVVQTIDSLLTFTTNPVVNGKELLEQVCEALNITETWWFGLLGRNKKNYNVWVEDKKKTTLTDLKLYPETNAHVKLCVKYYPEDAKLELLTFETKKYFFKSEIQRYLTGEVVIEADDIVKYITGYLKLVCSQKKDLTPQDALAKRFDRLIPPHIFSKYSITKAEWTSKLLSAYEIYKDMHVIDVIDDRLELMENSHMYGISYYDIMNKKHTPLSLGVDALGLYIYKRTDKINPQIGFPWSEIYSVAYEDKKFTISPVDKSAPPLVIYSPTLGQNVELLQRIYGNHEKYMQRRQPEPSNNAQFNKALAQKEIEVKERKRFEQQWDENAAYDKKVDELLKNAQPADDAKIQAELDKQYQISLQAMEQRVKEAERIAEEERLKQKQESAEAEELRKKTRELEKKVQSEKSAREAIALVESELASQAEMKALEVERLSAQLEALKLKHTADLEKLKDLETATAKRDAESASVKTYAEVKMAVKADAKEKIEDVANEIKKTQKSGMEVTEAIQKNRKEGKDKFKTLELVRRGNTKARVDEFEAL